MKKRLRCCPFGFVWVPFGCLWSPLGCPWAGFGLLWDALGPSLGVLWGTFGPWQVPRARELRSDAYSDKICVFGTRHGSHGSHRNRGSNRSGVKNGDSEPTSTHAGGQDDGSYANSHKRYTKCSNFPLMTMEVLIDQYHYSSTFQCGF